MITFKSKKLGLRKINRMKINPLTDQVKQLMGNQGLILMVRG
ncbi:MAG: hypothetical protein PHQ59_05740 [Candidatus Daviesbacteria bacterium]|nr:hypothetical protein [Candidatus Daviesbacteria bacterium]